MIVKHLKRYGQITEALARHGLSHLADTLDLKGFIPRRHGLHSRPPRFDSTTRPEQLRLTLEELGTTFIKLGQAFSTRPDLFDAEDRSASIAKTRSGGASPGVATG